jgi:hypothetical protein
MRGVKGMSLRRIIVPFAVVLAATLAGCATKDRTGHTPKPGNGIVEYHHVTKDAIKAVRSALSSLRTTGSYTNGLTSKVSTAFIHEVERLEVDSIQVRARSQAILARGDAYFAHWQDNLARMDDPAVRELAAKHRPQLESSFGAIKLASQRARLSFQSFLTDLRRLRTEVENDPRALTKDSNQDMARAAEEAGRQVEQELAGIQHELSHMMAMLTPAKPRSRR